MRARAAKGAAISEAVGSCGPFSWNQSNQRGGRKVPQSTPLSVYAEKHSKCRNRFAVEILFDTNAIFK